MDARAFDGISRAVGTGTPRRQVLRMLAGGVLAGVRLGRIRAGTAALRGKRCCKKQKRRYHEAKEDCEAGLAPCCAWSVCNTPKR